MTNDHCPKIAHKSPESLNDYVFLKMSQQKLPRRTTCLTEWEFAETTI